ncbi:hypothetical protein AMEX_G2979, partial [Astyanax mexicanus]
VFIERKFEFSCKEELLSCRGHDCPYCTKAVTRSDEHLLKRHLRFAIHYTEGDTNKFSIPCYCPDVKQSKRSHWHCTKCKKVIHRSDDFRTHLGKHDEKTSNLDTLHVSDSKGDTKLLCQKCGLLFTTSSNLRRHERQQHGSQEQPMLCIDQKNGIYVTPKNPHGARLPIHVCKCFESQTFLCELESCRDFMGIATRSGNPGKECHHLERTRNAQVYSPPPALRNDSLQEMVEKGLISKSRQEDCMSLKQKAFLAEVDCVFPVFWGDYGLSERYIYFSVYTGQKDNWCMFARTHVTFDTKSGKWHCQCRGTKNRLSCVHRYLSMWWIFQERPQLVQNATETNADEIEDMEELVLETEDAEDKHHPKNTCMSVITMTNYFWNCKRIPEQLPDDLSTKEKPLPEKFEPNEKKCPYCPGPTPPDLVLKLITRHATVYGIFTVNKGTI